MSMTRRGFLEGAATSFFVGGCLSSATPRRIGPNDKVNVAIIGCGLIARQTNVPGFLKDPRCRITIACDMVRQAPNYFYGEKGSGFGSEGFVGSDGNFREDICGSYVIKSIVDRHYGDKACREVVDWRDAIDDPTVDAVCICTPDHWHAIIAIAAMRRGKHVFCQKPLSLSISEGKAMTKVWKETGVTFQTGNQGRNRPALRLANELIYNGYLGKIQGVTVTLPKGNHWVGHGYSAARAPLPSYFTKETWDLWQGPAKHWEDDAYIPSIHDPTCWRFNSRYGNGMISDFGAHEFDSLQRTLGMDLSGPVSVENVKSNMRETRNLDVFSWPSEYSFDFVYANGVRAEIRNITEKLPRQTVFHTEKGDAGFAAGKAFVPESFKSFKESDFKESDTLFYAAKNGHDDKLCHESDFLDGVIESRQCCSTCEVGHRTISMSHIANTAIRLGVSKLTWDPAREVFVGPNAEAANAASVTEYHNGWSLDA